MKTHRLLLCLLLNFFCVQNFMPATAHSMTKNRVIDQWQLRQERASKNINRNQFYLQSKSRIDYFIAQRNFKQARRIIQTGLSLPLRLNKYDQTATVMLFLKLMIISEKEGNTAEEEFVGERILHIIATQATLLPFEVIGEIFYRITMRTLLRQDFRKAETRLRQLLSSAYIDKDVRDMIIARLLTLIQLARGYPINRSTIDMLPGFYHGLFKALEYHNTESDNLPQDTHIANAHTLRWLYGALLQPRLDRDVQRHILAIALAYRGADVEQLREDHRLLLAARSSPLLQARANELDRLLAAHERLIWDGPRRDIGRPLDTSVDQTLRQLRYRIANHRRWLSTQATILGLLASTTKANVIPELYVRKNLNNALEKIEALKKLLKERSSQALLLLLRGYKIHRDSQIPQEVYIAVLMNSSQEPIVREIGDVSAVDEQIFLTIRQLADPHSLPQSSLNQLYKQLIYPFATALAEARRLFVLSDGNLQLLPLQALHDGKNYLASHVTVVYLSSANDLQNQPSAGIRRGARLFAVSDVTKPAQGALPPTPRVVQDGQEPASQRSVLASQPVLTAVVPEVSDLADLLGASAQTYLEERATEAAFRQAPPPSLLHLAVHGVYLPSPASQGSTAAPFAADRQRGAFRGGLSMGWFPNYPNRSAERLLDPDEALSYSALLLAGAAVSSHRAPLMRDGVVTAREVMQMDFSGTSLVTLSACGSAVGLTVPDQGILGLPRAFLIAGANSVVASLWSVDDAASAQFMLRFYRHLLPSGSAVRTRAEALQEAMKGGLKNGEHPYYWAPFILMGMDGPLVLSASAEPNQLPGNASK